MGFDLSKLIADLRQQKQKYHAKVLSLSAIDVNFTRLLDLLDLFAFYVWLYIPEFDFTDLALSLLLDIPPIEFEPLNWNFNVELPELEELLQGILADIKKWDISEEYEWLKSIEDYIRKNFVEKLKTINVLTGEEYTIENIQETMTSYRLQKGVYGKTSYSQSYYDPPVVREFLRSTLIKLWVERKTDVLLKKDIDISRTVMNIARDLAKYMYNKLSMITSAQKSTFILGYSLLGQSYLGERASDLAKLRFYDYDGNLVEAKVKSLDHIQYGFILGITPLGYGFLLPRDSIYVKPDTTIVTVTGPTHTTKGSPPSVRLIEHRVRRIIRQCRWSAFSFANYNKPEEQVDWRKSERTDQWFNLQLMRYQVERIVDPIIRQYESNPVKIRMYKSATLQLVSGKAKRHVWGYKAYESMSEEEFYQWWLEHWKTQGLNPELLNTIYTRVKAWLREWRLLKLQLGQRVKQRRYSLAQTT